VRQCPAVAGLRRTLYIGAALTAVFGLALAIAPHWSIVTVANQPPYPDYAGARVLGVGAFASAMLMVMVANHVEQNWWWSWAFVIQAGGIALVAVTRAIAGGASGAWWVLAAATGLLAVALVAGLAKTGTERTPV
jgi:peptidoglycan/LPS O-acetylase OafA/YrhL